MNWILRSSMNVIGMRKQEQPAYDPKILLKIILFAYARGITFSRRIARACEENIIFMALNCDAKPHFTTIADFVSTMDKEMPPDLYVYLVNFLLNPTKPTRPKPRSQIAEGIGVGDPGPTKP